ncbi:MAG: hypothetical protein ACREOL_05540 [Candidatus Dormibacteria bacterium]
MSAEAREPESRLPPVTQVTVASMALVIAGGIILAAYMPKPAPLLGPLVLILAGAALLLLALGLLSRVRLFAWDRFFQVGGWALAAYVVIAGLIEYVLLIDRSQGQFLLLMTVTLAVFALDIPILLAFSVASHQEADTAAVR